MSSHFGLSCSLRIATLRRQNVDDLTGFKYITIVYLVGVGFWFATAQAKFSKSSRAKPLLFLMVACSLVAALTTIGKTIATPVPLARIIITIMTTTLCVLTIKWAFSSINKKNLGLVFSGIIPSEIVQHGPYRYVRHPLYLAYSMFWVGCVILSASMIVGVSVAIIILFYVAAARAEERELMSSNLGVGYSEYRRRTGLIFPRFF
jgi:protein-S-isoprenylcysteine O-methyltransferase Ste14